MNARAWIASLSGATLVAALSVVTVAVPAADAAPPVEVPVGTLTLSTGSVDSLVYDKGTTSTADDITQDVGKSGKCALSPASGPLVDWSAAGSSNVVGFYNDSIGVAQKSGSGSSGTSCSRVSGSESLTLALPRTTGGAYDTFFGVAFANSATLDIEMKGEDTVVRADLTLGGASAGTFYLTSNDDDEDDRSVNDRPNTTLCNAGETDSGPDSGSRDNCDWTISDVRFDTVRLSSEHGSFSLEGGGDYGAQAGAHRTTFSMAVLADGTIDCNTSTGPVTSTTGDVSSVQVNRLDNGDGSACAPLPFTLRTDAGSATFHKPGDTQGSAQFTLSLTRTVPASSGIDPLTVDWEDGTPVYDLPWCKTGLKTGSTFNYSVLTAADDASSITPGIQYACQFGLDPTFNEDDATLTIVDSVYFTGDIKFTTR
ncbi:MAG: hypothetical protein AB7O74_15655 [Candidatus Nanopelagicales bacterium]